MEKKKETKLNKDGTYTITEVIETTPEDGFVHQPDINKTDINNHGEFHKGYQKKFSMTTSDPKITRPFAYGICGFFLGIGLFKVTLNKGSSCPTLISSSSHNLTENDSSSKLFKKDFINI